MKRLSKKEWVAVAAAAVFVAYVFFGGDIMRLFQSNKMNQDLTAAAAGTSNEKTAAAEVSDSKVVTAQSSNSNEIGVAIRDMVVGQGQEVRRGQKISVNYVLALSDGTIIQNSKDLGTPFIFTLGAGEVIPGWEAGFSGMKVGGVRIIVIPPELGYGSAQVGPIPANSTLIFTVEVLDVTNATPQAVQ